MEPTKNPPRETPIETATAPAAPAASPDHPDPTVRRFLKLAARYSSAPIEAKHRWQVDLEADLSWWLALVASLPLSLDIIASLDTIDDWTEGQTRTRQGKPGWKPGGWKAGIRNWLRRDAKKAAAEPQREHTRRKTVGELMAYAQSLKEPQNAQQNGDNGFAHPSAGGWFGSGAE
tara:strand:- start:2873 stop:3397 length:525 start_codon:yes stop_codon:yes gene_type:complete